MMSYRILNNESLAGTFFYRLSAFTLIFEVYFVDDTCTFIEATFLNEIE